ncbi:hypothetical protein LshimejAT787_0310990 [Lyophyllum shimeji]|uniref:Uncharacterized protein n=1 Tax=Lyophyllum shimeji TaxID=47721 RepID=A0A9P3PK58_LYOSH|nr:hypothetical protein LshimejAT787_0310990 [Lyophyllum shimeji]
MPVVPDASSSAGGRPSLSHTQKRGFLKLLKPDNSPPPAQVGSGNCKEGKDPDLRPAMYAVDCARKNAMLGFKRNGVENECLSKKEMLQRLLMGAEKQVSDEHLGKDTFSQLRRPG